MLCFGMMYQIKAIFHGGRASLWNKNVKKEMHKSRRNILVTCIAFALLFALIGTWVIHHAYWHSFSTEKWVAYPNRRADMTGDLFHTHELVGMSREQIRALPGREETRSVPFPQENRLVYCLGRERTFTDREWLLIDFDSDSVSEYTIMMD